MSAKGDAFHSAFRRDAPGAIHHIKRAVQLSNLRVFQSGVAFKIEVIFEHGGA
tara:strand:- start:38 stop:196 length:159 start_codon:yes stop_codon:yes gene_type:complete